MNFKDTTTGEIITLEEVKEWYVNARQNGDLKYINFQDYLLDQINKYGAIEII